MFVETMSLLIKNRAEPHDCFGFTQRFPSFGAKALAKRLDICTEHALDKCPVQNVVSFCHLVQSCSVVFSDVESCSVDFEGSQKCSVDKIKFLLFEENVQSFCHPTEHCPVCASALQIQEREFRHDGEEMESSA